MGVGVGLYGTYDVSNVFVGDLTEGKIPIAVRHYTSSDLIWY